MDFGMIRTLKDSAGRHALVAFIIYKYVLNIGNSDIHGTTVYRNARNSRRQGKQLLKYYRQSWRSGTVEEYFPHSSSYRMGEGNWL
jgi:hypothetical protein